MNYRELCQTLVHEAGIAGGRTDIPALVSAPEDGQIAKVVNFIATADLYIQNRYDDWNFLWAVWETNLAQDDATPELPSAFTMRRWDTRSFVLNPTESNYIPLNWISYAEWRQDFRFGSWPAGQPAYITRLPDGRLQMDRGSDVATDVFHGEGWIEPERMVTDTDTSRIPEGFHRVIIARAGVMYGQSEDAPELVARFSIEYDEQFDALKAQYLPDRMDGMSQPDRAMTATTR